MSLLMKFPFHRFSDEITADDNDVKFKQWNGRERSLYFEPRYDFGDFRYVKRGNVRRNYVASSAGITQLLQLVLYFE